jgi:hypothetical protein
MLPGRTLLTVSHCSIAPNSNQRHSIVPCSNPGDDTVDVIAWTVILTNCSLITLGWTSLAVLVLMRLRRHDATLLCRCTIRSGLALSWSGISAFADAPLAAFSKRPRRSIHEGHAIRNYRLWRGKPSYEESVHELSGPEAVDEPVVNPIRPDISFDWNPWD